MMKDDSPTPEVPEDGMHASTPAQADWPVKQVKELARELYIRAPFPVKDKERWKGLVRQAFDFFDNLHMACEEILRERSEMREMSAEADAREIDAYKKLPDVAAFDKAVRCITGEKYTARALPKFDKVLRYGPRIVPHAWPTRLLPELPAEKKREIEAQLEMWRQNGIPRSEVIRLQSLFKRDWPHVVAEQNRAKKKRRGEKLLEVERGLQRVLALGALVEREKKKRSDLT